MQKLWETCPGNWAEHSPSLGLLLQPRAYQIPTLSWHCIQDETMNFPCQKGPRDLSCQSLHKLGIRCSYLSTYHRKLPAIKSCNTIVKEGNAPLWKNISNFTTNPHWKPLGKRRKKNASEEIFLRKLFSLNRKHFVMEKFYLRPMKQSVFCIINYWVLVRYMLNGWLERTCFCLSDPFSTSV